MLYSASAQIVHDPLHMSSNLLQFSNSIATAIESVESVEKVWNAAAETKEHLNTINERVRQVNQLLKNAQEVENSINYLIEMADMVTLVANQIQKASTITSATSMWTESTEALDMFSKCLTRATHRLLDIKQALTDSWAMVDAERKALLERNEAGLAEDAERMAAAAAEMKKAHDIGYIQAKISDKYLSGQTHKELMGPADMFIITTANCAIEASGTEPLIVAASNFFGKEKRKSSNAVVAEGKVGGIAGSFFTLYYAICGIMGLIGAYKVYSKVQLGEDFGKAAAIWLGGAVGSYFLGVLVQEFFF
jgi:hypothetical protein